MADIRQTHTDKIATYSGLNRACLLAKQTLPLQAWYILRYNIPNGCGHMPYTQAVRCLLDAGWRPEKIRKIFLRGEGLWWRFSAHRILLTGLKKLVEFFDLPNEGNMVMLGKEHFKNLRVWNAYLYASWFAATNCTIVDDTLQPVGGNQISRSMIGKLFGISKCTQIRYEKLSHMTVTHCIAVHDDPDPTTCPSLPLFSDHHHKFFRRDYNHDGTPELCERLPNSYHSQLETINRRKRAKAESGTNCHARPSRLFFRNTRAAVNSLTSRKSTRTCAYALQKIEHGRAIYKFLHI